jgi:quinate dehydrogenase (quinone)
MLLALLFVIAGLFFVIGGALLIGRGGSPYYLIAGAAMLVLSWGLVRNKTYSGPLFLAIFVVTLVWSLWEAGLDFWPLFARMFFFVVAGALLAWALPSLRKNVGVDPQTKLHYGVAGVLAVVAIASFAGTYKDRGTYNFAASTGTEAVTPETEQKNWDNYGSNAEGERFVALDQINKTNVDQLEVAWTYRHGDIPESPNGIGREDLNTPLQIGNTVYFCTPKNNVVALDATTGQEKWKAIVDAKNKTWARCRGIAYFDGTGEQPNRAQEGLKLRASVEAATNGGACGRRILTNTVDAQLIAIDAETGEFCKDFGTDGRLDLTANMGFIPTERYKQTSGPTIAGDLVVVGAFVDDNLTTDMPSGVIRAFDVRTGQLRWAWDSGNPDVKGAPTEEAPYSRGSPNVWAPMSYDPKTDMLFMPMGNHSPDLWGGNRTEEKEKHAASVVALRAADGSHVWTYQTVHHDLWDFDVPMQPTLTTFPKDGKEVPAVVFGTKLGMIFALDRMTGQPLTKVEERPVAAGNLKGERYSPTQPFSVDFPQLGADPVTEADMWGATPFDQLMCRLDFKTMVNKGLYSPPSLEKQLLLPGSLGGFNWGGISVDPTGNTIFVNDMRVGLRLQMGERKSADEKLPGVGLPMEGTPYYVKEKTRFFSPLGIPCQEPPFGTVSAIDLKTGKLAWSVPAGTVEDAQVMGIPVTFGMPVGLPTIGGSMATQGGLLFFASTMDYYLRAYDSSTGKELWKGRLPVGSQSTPISYKSTETGEQFVLISAGGARSSPDRGDYVIAYKLKK